VNVDAHSNKIALSLIRGKPRGIYPKRE